MKRACAALVILLLLTMGSARAEIIRLFYEEPCLSCDDGSVLSGAVALLEGLYAPEKARLEGVNAFSRREELKSAAEALGLRLSSLELPAVFFPDGTVIAGEEALTQSLREQYAAFTGAEEVGESPEAARSAASAASRDTACDTDLSAKAGPAGFMWFLCTPNCESCRAVAPLIEKMEAAGVTVRYVNCATDADAAQRLFTLYGVPEERRFAPCALIGEVYLAGQEAIAAGLEDAVSRGDARATRELARSRVLLWTASAALALTAVGLILFTVRKRRRAG